MKIQNVSDDLVTIQPVRISDDPLLRTLQLAPGAQALVSTAMAGQSYDLQRQITAGNISVIDETEPVGAPHSVSPTFIGAGPIVVSGTPVAGQVVVATSATAADWASAPAALDATNLSGGAAGKIPYQSAASTTLFTAAGSSGQYLKSAGTSAPVWDSLGNHFLYMDSAAGAGGSPTEALTVTGLLTTDVVLAVSQKTPGANSLPLIGFGSQATNSLTGTWSADPGAGTVIRVSVYRA